MTQEENKTDALVVTDEMCKKMFSSLPGGKITNEMIKKTWNIINTKNRNDMTEEQKDKLLKYLCMALPYNVVVMYKIDTDEIERATTFNGNNARDLMEGRSPWVEYKPYLRPMSSMTDEECDEWALVESDEYGVNDIIWLLENHFDFMGLIDEGIAIDCTGLNIY